jgi:hypothetical protein
MAIEIAPAFAELTLTDSGAGLRVRARNGLSALGASAEIALVYATAHHKSEIRPERIKKLVAAAIVASVFPTPLEAFAPHGFRPRENANFS